MDTVVNETFGPVAPLIKVKSVDEVIEIANATEYGLQSGVFTENYRNALRCANEIEAETVFITNCQHSEQITCSSEDLKIVDVEKKELNMLLKK